MIHELSNTIQPYAWGSRTALAELRGAPAPSAGPEAELWMGAHPLAPSRLSATNESLIELIARAPAQQLGPWVVEQLGPKLPFLLKVLAAATPLSLQAHPSLSQAAAGFDADDRAGIPLGAPQRNYKDKNHKPELLCALTEFWALCGFRDVEKTLALFAELAVPELEPFLAMLRSAPNEAGLRSVFSALMNAEAAQRTRLAVLTAAACQRQLGHASAFAAEHSWAVQIAELYPGDVGVVSALLLNLLRLEPGEAIYLPAGNLHAYLGGTGVEIMASSDNVLRGGLTPKHVNVPELLRVLDFRPLAVEPLRPVTVQHEHVFRTPAREFQLSYFELGAAEQQAGIQGPEIWLVSEGHAQLVAADGTRLELTAGRSAFVPAATQLLTFRGLGRVFRASVAHSA